MKSNFNNQIFSTAGALVVVRVYGVRPKYPSAIVNHVNSVNSVCSVEGGATSISDGIFDIHPHATSWFWRDEFDENWKTVSLSFENRCSKARRQIPSPGDFSQPGKLFHCLGDGKRLPPLIYISVHLEHVIGRHAFVKSFTPVSRNIFGQNLGSFSNNLSIFVQLSTQIQTHSGCFVEKFSLNFAIITNRVILCVNS